MALFDFLRQEWPEVFDSADKAAAAVYPDARTACFNARRALELAVGWMFKHDPALRLPYVLWGDDGKPLALVEAKRTCRDPRQGKRQAELYADCLEEAFGQRPIIFYSNGYEHWIWDDRMYPPRQVQGFYKKSELAR
jgi:type I site-specific restriction endonuclease